MKPISSSEYVKRSETFNGPNKYIILLKRLDEDEGLSEPSIEEKLKLAEDYLRLSCVKFCEVTSTLLDDKNKDKRIRPDLVQPQMIQELFEAKSFKPSFRPPRSELKVLSKEKKEVCNLKPSTVELKDDLLTSKKLKQAYYLPPSSWFSSEKSSIDLSKEEVELLSSCATKAFVKFLEEKKMEIPKIFAFHLQKSQEKYDNKDDL